MDLFDEFFKLWEEWSLDCTNRKVSSMDYMVEFGKTNATIVGLLLESIAKDDLEAKEELLENYLANMERIIRLVFKEKGERECPKEP